MKPSTTDGWAREHRRTALDHVLGLVAAAPCGDSLVLRGSMAMLAWFGTAAREPADIDWVVRPGALVPVDEDSRYPYLETLRDVRLWPEAAHDAVLLAEAGITAGLPVAAGIRGWTVEGPGDPRPWLDRLARALAAP